MIALVGRWAVLCGWPQQEWIACSPECDTRDDESRCQAFRTQPEAFAYALDQATRDKKVAAHMPPVA